MSPFARTSDPETSHEAAASVMTGTVKQLQADIIWELEFHGALTDEQILELVQGHHESPVSPSSLRTRRRELVDDGIVRTAEGRGTTEAGRACYKWELVPEQRLF